MKNKKKIDKINIFIISFLYFSLIAGFIFDENLNYGAIMDWVGTNRPVIKSFANDFTNTLLDYEKFGHRHSPIYLIFLSSLYKIGFSLDIVRLIHLNLSLLLIYYFFKCLTLKFDNVDRNILILLSVSIFLSPTFRSLSIWPDTRIIGLTFLSISIFEFLKFKKSKKILHFWRNITFLIISSYISPNFSLFIIYFFYYYLNHIKLKKIVQAILFCLICSFPAFYYIFVMDVNFLTAGTPGAIEGESISLDFNLSNKILIITSIIFFQLTPFLVSKDFVGKLYLHAKKNIVFIILFFLLNLYFFDYVTNFTGGGFFFQISQIFLKNNLLFYFFCIISLIFLSFLIKKNLNNFLIIFLLIISNIQNTIYHKYYDPLIMILFFTIIQSSVQKDFLKNKINLIYVYIFYLIFITMRIVKNIFFLV